MSVKNKELFCLLFACLLFAACNSASPPTAVKNTSTAQAKADSGHGHDEDALATVQRISLEDAKKDFDSGNAVFIDTRDQSTFRFKRIKGAINIPTNEIDLKFGQLPKDKKIIAYCS